MSNDPSTDPGTELSAEDAKLVTLARATRARARAEEGAAVRDLDGRTYAAASVRLEHLTLSALEVCVAMALASAAAGLEAAVVCAAHDGGEPVLRVVECPGAARGVLLRLQSALNLPDR